MKLNELIDDYYSSYDFKVLRDDTKKQYEYLIRVMLDTVVEGKPLCRYALDKITTRMAKDAYNQWCEKGITTANHLMSITRVLFNHGIRMEHCVINPFAIIRRRTTEARKIVWSRDDVMKFLDAAYGDFSTRNIGLIAHMAYEWCQRVGDMRMLTWGCINFDEQTVHIEQSKRRADVYLPICV